MRSFCCVLLAPDRLINRVMPSAAVIAMTLFSHSSAATIAEDLGYDDLSALLGASVPDGANTSVIQVEAGSNWFPDTANADFAGKTIIDLGVPSSPGTSNHATNVGRRFYGTNLSFTPAITDVGVYDVNGFLFNFLQFNMLPVSTPWTTDRRVANHSWVGSNFVDENDDPVPEATADVLRRLDWVIHEDEYINIAGPNNGGSARPLLTTAYNVVTVGRTDAAHLQTVSALDSVYISGRPAIHVVAPQPSSSTAAPYGSSVAVLLIEAAQNNPGWSSGSTTNRSGDTLYNAERSETIKAAMMAGATRFRMNTLANGNIIDYRVNPANQTDNGLDWRYGAGQIDVYDSYLILAAGEQASNQDGGAGPVGFTGFDYDPAFGGSAGSNNVAEYDLGTASAGQLLAASLVWNIDVTGPAGPSAFNTATELYDLNLQLIDTTGGGNTVVASSTSSIDNTETIYFELVPGNDYRLRVDESGSNFNWDYALAWRVHDFGDYDTDGTPDHADTDPLDPCVPSTFVIDCSFDTDSDGIDDYDEGETTDTDGDGQPDYLESNIVDDDGDGIFNHLESSIADSDNDGVPDQFDIWNDNACLPDHTMCEEQIPLLPLWAQLAMLSLLLSGGLASLVRGRSNADQS